jgi:hypothetical protein
MTYSLLMHKNYDRYVTDAGYTAVAVFNIRSKVASELNNLKEQGDSIPDSIENYLERVFHLTQNIDSAWSESLRPSGRDFDGRQFRQRSRPMGGPALHFSL